MPNIDFKSLMDDTSETVERPKSAPVCWLIGVIGTSYCEATKGQETPYLALPLHSIEAAPNNDPEVLETLETLDLSKLRSPYRRNLEATYWLTPDAKYHLTDALDRVVGGRNRTIRERVPELTGQRVLFKATPKFDDNGNDLGQNEVDGRTLTLAP